MNEKARQQWKAPISWFKENVKCCYNCTHWCEDLDTKDKEYARRFANNNCPHRNLFTSFDNYCIDYDGNANDENLIVKLTVEECKILISEDKETKND